MRTNIGFISALVSLAIATPAGASYTSSMKPTIKTIKVSAIDDNMPEYGCTLREAITLANEGLDAGNDCIVKQKGSGAETIYRLLVPAMTYTLQGVAGEDDNVTGDLDIYSPDNIKIIGAGAHQTIIQAGEMATDVSVDRVFHIKRNSEGISGDVLISGMTIRHGDGGEDYAGGGIFASGESGTRLTIKQCVITANEGKWGGGLSHETTDGILHIKSSYFTDNKTTRFGGGGIRLSGTDSTTTITGSTISRNEGISEGGGIEHISTDGDLTIRNSLISNNTATVGHGGGISHDGNDDGSLTIYRSRIQGNFAETSGGGIFDESAGEINVISLVGVSIKGNTANAGDGGGILQSEATLNVKFSTIRNNTDVGGEAPDCSGTLNAGYFVRIGDPTGCTIIE